LERHTQAYREYLLDRGNAAGYVRSCEAAVMHLSMWMKQANKRVADVGEGLVTEFLERHLLVCHCATSARHPTTVRAALDHLLIVLRAADAIAPKPLDTTALGQELGRYDQYMDQVRGLAPKTQEGALRLVEALLRKHFDDDAIGFEVITPEHVRRFFAIQAKNYKTASSRASWSRPCEATSAGARRWATVPMRWLAPWRIPRTRSWHRCPSRWSWQRSNNSRPLSARAARRCCAPMPWCAALSILAYEVARSHA
jgi:hypothetical protein